MRQGKDSAGYTNITVIAVIVAVVVGITFYSYINGKVPFGLNAPTSSETNTTAQSTVIPISPGHQLQLTNNPTARNVLQRELKTFISGDGIDREITIPGSRDNDYFAKNVHDKAEADGKRAGVVVISFIGKGYKYVINVFETIDRGKIYIDCTGPYMSDTTQNATYDKVAYIKAGSEYGVIDLQTVFAYGSVSALQYEFYDKYRQNHNITYTLPVGIVETMEEYW